MLIKKKRKKKVLGKKAKVSREFYKSKEWVDLALLTKKLYGRVCMKCGKASKYIQSDHIFPKSLFPEKALSINNIQILCKKCNRIKSNKNCIDYRTEKNLIILKKYLESV